MKRTMRLPVTDEPDSTTGHSTMTSTMASITTSNGSSSSGSSSKIKSKNLTTTSTKTTTTATTTTASTTDVTVNNENNDQDLLSKLVIGIESNDMDLVASVFNGQVVCSVMKDLPLPLVMPLLRLIRKKVARKSVQSIHHLDWLESLIHCKLGYLISCQNIDAEIGYLLDSLNVKVDVFDRVIQLQGKLDLLMAQLNSSESRMNINSLPSFTKMKAKATYIDPDESESDENNEAIDEEEEDEQIDQDNEGMDVVHDDQVASVSHQETNLTIEDDDDEVDFRIDTIGDVTLSKTAKDLEPQTVEVRKSTRKRKSRSQQINGKINGKAKKINN